MGKSKEEIVAHQENKFQSDFIEQTNRKINCFEDDLDKCYQLVENFNQSLESKIKSLEIEISNMQEKNAAGIRKFNDLVDGFLENFHILESDLEDISTVIAKQEESTKKIHLSVDNLVDNFYQVRNEMSSMRNGISNDIGDCSRVFDYKLKVLKEEILSKPSPTENLKQEFSQKIEMVELNSQNGVLRASNCEKSIQLLERKIEQVNAMIRAIQIELQKV